MTITEVCWHGQRPLPSGLQQVSDDDYWGLLAWSATIAIWADAAAFIQQFACAIARLPLCTLF